MTRRPVGPTTPTKYTYPKKKKKSFRNPKTFHESKCPEAVKEDLCGSIESSCKSVGGSRKSHQSQCPSVKDDVCDSIGSLPKSVAGNKSKSHKGPINNDIRTASDMSNLSCQKIDRKSVKLAKSSMIHPVDCCCTDCDKGIPPDDCSFKDCNKGEMNAAGSLQIFKEFYFQ